jgi:hypothetical protein
MVENMLQDESHLSPKATYYLQSKLTTVEGYLQDALRYENPADHDPRYYPDDPAYISVNSKVARREIDRLNALRSNPRSLNQELAMGIQERLSNLREAQGKMVPILPEDPQQNPYQKEAMRGDRIFSRASRISSTPGAPPDVIRLAREIQADTERGERLSELEGYLAQISEYQAIQAELGFAPTS